MQTLQGNYHQARFWDDPNRFSTMWLDQRGFFWERYVRDGQGWRIEASSELLAPPGWYVRARGRWFILTGPASPPKWLTWLSECGGDWGKLQLRKWWPQTTEVTVVDIESGRVTNRVELPGLIHEVSIVPNEDRLVTLSRNELKMWTSPQPRSWPGLVGLLSGLVASICLWRISRHPRQLPVPPEAASSSVHSLPTA
jgi:hypothetical protein